MWCLKNMSSPFHSKQYRCRHLPSQHCQDFTGWRKTRRRVLALKGIIVSTAATVPQPPCLVGETLRDEHDL